MYSDLIYLLLLSNIQVFLFEQFFQDEICVRRRLKDRNTRILLYLTIIKAITIYCYTFQLLRLLMSLCLPLQSYSPSL